MSATGSLTERDHKQNWFSQQWEALVLNSEIRKNG
jgi:hypothetical protein